MKPININDRLPELGQFALFLCNYSNDYCHVYRAITDKERWFYADTAEIASDFFIEEYTHWIPLDHKGHWK